MIQVSGKIVAESEWYDLIQGEETEKEEETKPYTSEFLKEEDTETELAADVTPESSEKEDSKKSFDEKEDTEVTIVEDEKEKKITSSWGILIEDGKNATFGIEVESDIVPEEEEKIEDRGSRLEVSEEKEKKKEDRGNKKTMNSEELIVNSEEKKEKEVKSMPSTKMVQGERLTVSKEKEKKTEDKGSRLEVSEEKKRKKKKIEIAEKVEEEFTQTEAEIIVKDASENVVSDLKQDQQKMFRQKKKRFPVLLILISIVVIGAVGYYFFIVKGIKIPFINREKTVDKTKETDINDLLSTGKDDLLVIEKNYIVETEKLSEDQLGKIENLIEKYNGNLLEVDGGYKMTFNFKKKDNANELKTLLEEKEIKCTIKEQ
jgi:hypothetical protein